MRNTAGTTSSNPTSDLLAAQLERFAILAVPVLRQERRVAFGRPPPRSASRKLMVRALAYRLQEQRLGGLESTVQRRLARLGKQDSNLKPIGGR